MFRGRGYFLISRQREDVLGGQAEELEDSGHYF